MNAPGSMQFGGSGICQDLYDTIRELLPAGSTILELGSGNVSTQYLSENYRMFSVEDRLEWVGRHHSTYIHAPLVNGWYDTLILSRELPDGYDLILVDGPTGEGNRTGFVNHLWLFKTHVPILFDDTNRPAEHDLATQVALRIDRPVNFFIHHAVIH